MPSMKSSSVKLRLGCSRRETRGEWRGRCSASSLKILLKLRGKWGKGTKASEFRTPLFTHQRSLQGLQSKCNFDKNFLFCISSIIKYLQCWHFLIFDIQEDIQGKIQKIHFEAITQVKSYDLTFWIFPLNILLNIKNRQLSQKHSIRYYLNKYYLKVSTRFWQLVYIWWHPMDLMDLIGLICLCWMWNLCSW